MKEEISTSRQTTKRQAQRCSNIFKINKVIGVVCATTPLSYYSSSSTHGHLAVSTGYSYYIANTESLKVIFHSKPFATQITAIYTILENTYIALDISYEIILQHRAETLGIFSQHHTDKIQDLFCIGNTLISYNHKEVLVWTIDKFTLDLELPIKFESAQQHITAILHPETYLNKLVVCFADPIRFEIWNFSTSKRIHSFQFVQQLMIQPGNSPASVMENPDAFFETFSIVQQESLTGNTNGKIEKQGISCCCLTFHTDVLAIGLYDGTIALVDLVQDKILQKFYQYEGHVTTLNYLTPQQLNSKKKNPILVSGTVTGNIHFWDTLSQLCVYTLKGAHSGFVMNVIPINNQMTMISAGHDNSLITWLFDKPDAPPRELRARQGLQQPAESIHVYDDISKYLICAGPTRSSQFSELACICTGSVIQGRHFPQAKALKRLTNRWRQPLKQLPPIISLSVNYTRHYDWGNIITAHKDLPAVFIWSGHDVRLLAYTLNHPYDGKPEYPSVPRALTTEISHCGNYAFVGYSNGQIGMFSLQAGTLRGMLEAQLPGPVLGMHYVLPNLLIAATHQPCCIYTYNTYKRQLEEKLELSPLLKSLNWKPFLQSLQVFGKMMAVTLTNIHPKKTNKMLNLPNDEKCANRAQGYGAELEDDHTENGTRPQTQTVKEKKNIFHHKTIKHIIKQEIALVDLITKTVVREIEIPENDQVSACTFSSDGRWLCYSTRFQPYLYVYDIISASLIDWVQFPSPITALTWNFQNNAYVYLSLRDLPGGIIILSNNCCFDSNLFNLVLRRAPDHPFILQQTEPQMLEMNTDEETNRATDLQEKTTDIVANIDSSLNDLLKSLTEHDVDISLNQLENICSKCTQKQRVMTLSGDSISKIQATLLFSEIHSRNANRPEFQAAEDIPFFLPSALELQQLSDRRSSMKTTDINNAVHSAPEIEETSMPKSTDDDALLSGPKDTKKALRVHKKNSSVSTKSSNSNGGGFSDTEDDWDISKSPNDSMTDLFGITKKKPQSFELQNHLISLINKKISQADLLDYLNSLSPPSLYKQFTLLLENTGIDLNLQYDIILILIQVFANAMESKEQIDRVQTFIQIFLKENFMAVYALLNPKKKISLQLKHKVDLLSKELMKLKNMIKTDYDFLESQCNLIEFHLKFLSFLQIE